jgi:hypothetical protein
MTNLIALPANTKTSLPVDPASPNPLFSNPQYWIASEWSFVDEKGRKVTGGVSVRADASSLSRYENGEYTVTYGTTYWAVATHAQRDGEGFGAIPRRTCFPTLEEALAAAPKKLAEQGKRYAKKYGSK